MIEVEKLTKRYGPRTAVENVSFRVDRGEIVGFLGPNGAGKSTTLRMVTGFLAPSGGAIRIDGIDALEEPTRAKQRIGYMPEACPLYPEMRVREYLRYRAELKGVARRDVGLAVERALQLATVIEAGDRIIGQLSKGTRQRVGLADALVADPPILVLDEPTAGLDPNQIRQVRDLVRGLAGKKTVLVSTHILPEVEATCDRVVIIHRGRVVTEGTPEGLRSKTAGLAAVAIEGRGEPGMWRAALGGVEGARLEAIEEIAGGIVRARVAIGEDPDAVERVFAAIVAAGLVLRELRREKSASLEDVFGKLTTDDAAAKHDDEGDGDKSDGDDSESDDDSESESESESDDDSESDESESGKRQSDERASDESDESESGKSQSDERASDESESESDESDESGSGPSRTGGGA